jgi:hypothetical protein
VYFFTKIPKDTAKLVMVKNGLKVCSIKEGQWYGVPELLEFESRKDIAAKDG